MLPADLRARLEAAGLPTDLEGMLEAADKKAHPLRFVLRTSALGWVADRSDRQPRPGIATTPGEAVARWLLAAKEVHHG